MLILRMLILLMLFLLLLFSVRAQRTYAGPHLSAVKTPRVCAQLDRGLTSALGDIRGVFLGNMYDLSTALFSPRIEGSPCAGNDRTRIGCGMLPIGQRKTIRAYLLEISFIIVHTHIVVRHSPSTLVSVPTSCYNFSLPVRQCISSHLSVYQLLAENTCNHTYISLLYYVSR